MLPSVGGFAMSSDGYFFSRLSLLFSFSLSLGDGPILTKYCLKGPLGPNQPTNIEREKKYTPFFPCSISEINIGEKQRYILDYDKSKTKIYPGGHLTNDFVLTSMRRHYVVFSRSRARYDPSNISQTVYFSYFMSTTI